jgi:hydroxymethylpyrimidine pyrophosphatase-like HAD family hydrolase
MIQVVVFDLDGTLADTAHITKKVRLPSHVLSLSRPGDSNSNLLMHMDLKRQVHWLINSGIKIYVITRAPKSYASTLIYLLGIDFQFLIPSSKRFSTVESKLHYIIESEAVTPSQVLYIGNEVGDEISSRNVGTFYQNIDEVFGSPENHSNHLQNLVSLCETAEESDSKSANKIEDIQNENLRVTNELLDLIDDRVTNPGFDPSNVLKVLTPQIFCSNPLDDKFLASDILKPFINPAFISRYEYDSDPSTREKLLRFIEQLGFASKLINPPFKIPERLFNGDLLVYSHYKYDDVSTWWAYIKDWKWPDSGPNVALLHLEFIVPVPPSEFSESKPSETSLRLALRVGQLSNTPVFALFKKDSEDNIYTEYPDTKFDRTVLLLDDQLTKGKSALKCLEILSEMGVRNVRLHTWTSKFFDIAKEY